MRTGWALLLVAALVGAGEATKADRAFERGRTHMAEKRWAEARAEFQSAARLFAAEGRTEQAARAAVGESTCRVALNDREGALAAVQFGVAAVETDAALRGGLFHAGMLVNLSHHYFELGRLAEAQASARTAADLARKAGSPHVEAQALRNLGSSYAAASDWAEAAAAYERALALSRKLSAEPSVLLAEILESLGFVFAKLGKADEGVASLHEAVDMWNGLAPGDHPGKARALSHLATTYAGVGRFADVLGPAEQAAAMLDRLGLDRGLDYVGVLDALATAYLRVGMSEKALAHAEQAVRVCKALDVPATVQATALAKAHANLATAYSALRRHVDALVEIEHARRLAPAADATTRTAVLHQYAHVLYRLNRQDEAVARQREAVAAAAALGDRQLEVAYRLHLCSMLVNAVPPRIEEARSLLGNAVEQARKQMGERSAYVAFALSTLARCHEHGGDLARARRCAAKALSICEERTPNGPEVADALLFLGWIYRRENEPGQAVERYRRAAEICAACGHPLRAAALAGLGAALVEAGERGRGLEVLERAVNLDGAFRDSNRALEIGDRIAADSDLQYPFRMLALAYVAEGRVDDAWRTWERGRARDVLDLLESAGLRSARTDALRREVGMARLRLAAGTEAPDEARAELVRLETELATARSGATELAAPDATRRTQGGWFLAYLIAAHESCVFVVPPRGEVRALTLRWPDGSPVTLDSVCAEVDAYLARVRRPSGARGLRRAPAAPAAGDGRRLFRALVPPALWKEIRVARRVAILPHVLSRLPFEALRVDESAYWIDRGPPVHYATSAGVLAWCAARRAGQQGAKGATVLALGDPETGGGGSRAAARRRYVRERLPALPGARAEVEAIRGVIGEEAVVLTRGDATEPALYRRSASARILHLAMHGIAAAEGSALLLAPSGDAEADDGILTVRDLLTRWKGRLTGCELVVLSACDSRRGRESLGEGAFGLPLGFHYAGCPAVIASQWPVDDQATAELFRDFYRRLTKGDGDKLESCAAGRAPLRRKRPDPYYWAPFVFLGDPR